MAKSIRPEFKARLASVLGLDPTMSRRIVIDVRPGDAVMVHVERYLDTEQEQPLLDALNRDQDGLIRVRHVDRVEVAMS